MEPATASIVLPVRTAVLSDVVLGKSKAIADRHKRPMEVQRWKAMKQDMHI